MNRRQFLILTGTTMVAGCRSSSDHGAPSGPGPGEVVDAGPAANYVADGVYQGFRYHGFFIVRKGEELFALSSICTHRKCRLKSESDCTFRCPCHGSTFDPAGHVTAGPARRDLPQFPTIVDEKGHLLVTLAK